MNNNSMKSVMTHQFSAAPTVEISRSKFDRSCGYKTTFDSGYLIPFYCDEVLPGDTFDVDSTILIRETTPIVPIMDNLKLSTFFFHVPSRLLWGRWKSFMGERKNPNDSIDYLLPTVTSPVGGFTVGSLFDYFGIPVGVANLTVNSLPLRAYNLIYQEWFKDENLINSPVIATGDGDSYTYYNLFRRGKRYDYFTSCLPWPQKGPGVSLPLGTSAPITGTLASSISADGNFKYNDGTNAFDVYSVNSNGVAIYTSGSVSDVSANKLNYDSGLKITNTLTGIVADLTNATAATINSLRQAFTLQAFYENWARGGTRYTEIIRSFFHVESPDGRLQRPEYLGGSTSMIDSQAVVQNSASNDVTPQGNLAAFVKDVSFGHGFTKSFTEHGYVIGIMCVDADLTYQQGLDRMWSRSSMFDFYWPTFAHLGEQAVLNKEIYAQGASVVDGDGNIIDDQVFGYQERYAEYRYKNSLITGKLRSGVTGSLDVWHLSQYFESLPKLNKAFIESDPPVARSLAVQDEPQFIADIYIKNICIRPMPLYGTPATIGAHF